MKYNILLFCLFIFSKSLLAQVVINEIITDPQQDWSTNNFDGTVGAGDITSGVDEWLELYISQDGIDLTGWTIELLDGTNVTGDLTNSGAFQTANYITASTGTFTNTKTGDYLVLGNVAGSGAMNNSITIVLKNASSTIIDQLILGGGGANAPSGNATGISDESISRIPNGTDSGIDSADFRQKEATMGASSGVILGANSAPKIPGFSYYPNPMRDVLTLTAAVPLVSATLVNLIGIEVLHVAFSKDSPVTLPLHGVAKGVYLLRVNALREQSVVKVIKI